MSIAKNVYTGYWFIPNESSKELSGTLTLDNDSRILLEFVAKEEELKLVVPEIFQLVHHINNQVPIPLVNGYAKNNETKKDISFTLVDLELIKYSQSGLIALTLEAKFCFNNYQAKYQKQLLFKSLMVKFDGFDEWMDKNGFQINSSDDPTKFSTELKYDQPKTIELLKNDDILIYFYFRARSPGFFVKGPRATIEQSIFLNIDFNKPQRLSELEYYVEKIQNFFTLINTHPTQRTYCQTKLYQDQKNKGRGIGNHIIDVIYKERVPDFSQYIKQGSALFNYSDVENQFPEFIKNWFRVYQLFEPALDQYFDTLYFNQGHAVSRFVNILSVLEIYHTRKFNKGISLKEKIKDLISQFSVINDQHFNFSDYFVDEVILIRKFYVHGTEVKTKFTDDMPSKENITKHVRSLENIFRIHLLLELGLNEEVLSKMIGQKPWKWGVSKV